MKEALREKLAAAGHQVTDFGAFSAEATDYPDYAVAVSNRVASGEAACGVLVCATGTGMSIAANKVAGIRAAVVSNKEAAELTRSHNDANVIALGSKLVSEEQAAQLIEIFLKTELDGGARHKRRIDKIAAIEHKNDQELATKA